MEEIRRPGFPRNRNILTMSDRIGEIAGIVLATLVAAFFVYHQIRNTGFMKADFGWFESLLLYGSFAFSIMSSGARAVMGRRDKARPFELASNVFLLVAALWFLTEFPFNFAHLADALPSTLRFILSWISNGIGWIIILLAFIGSTVAALYNSARLVLDRFWN